MKLPIITLLGACLAACQSAPPPAKTVALAELAAPQIDMSRFEVRTSEAVSLHFFAFHAARLTTGKKYRGYVPLLEADRAMLRDPKIAAAFAPLAKVYEPALEGRLLRGGLFAFLHSLDDGIAGIEDAEARAAFEAFMPVYREHFWPRHGKIAEDAASAMRAQIAEHGAAMAAAVADELDSDWGEADYIFYVAPYTNWAGAFSKDNHVYLSGLDEDVARYPLEIFFHETAHGDPIGSTLVPAASAALAEAGLENERFWHFLLFKATGAAAKRVLGEDYVPYSVGTGLTSRENLKPWYDALEKVWDQHETLEARAMAAAALVARSEARD